MLRPSGLCCPGSHETTPTIQLAFHSARRVSRRTNIKMKVDVREARHPTARTRGDLDLAQGGSSKHTLVSKLSRSNHSMAVGWMVSGWSQARMAGSWQRGLDLLLSCCFSPSVFLVFLGTKSTSRDVDSCRHRLPFRVNLGLTAPAVAVQIAHPSSKQTGR